MEGCSVVVGSPSTTVAVQGKETRGEPDFKCLRIQRRLHEPSHKRWEGEKRRDDRVCVKRGGGKIVGKKSSGDVVEGWGAEG